MESLVEIKVYPNGRYKYQEGKTVHNMNEIYAICQPFIVTGYSTKYYEDGTFLKIFKLENGVWVTFRTKSKNGPTVELNISHPKPYKLGEIIKIRCRGKLILMQLFFKKVFR